MHLCSIRGKNLIFPLVESNPDLPKEVADMILRICTDSFLKRPSLNEIAMNAIASFMNNAAFPIQRPEKIVMIDSAALFCVDDKIRSMTFGTARVLYFADGKLAYESPKRECPRLGLEAVISPDYSDVIELVKGANAVLECSKSVTDTLSVGQIEELLASSSSSEEWMQKLEAAIGGSGEYSAQCLIFPERKKKLLF